MRRGRGRGRARSRESAIADGVVLAALLLSGLASAAGAQRVDRRSLGMDAYFGDPNGYWTPPDFHGNHRYDGRFTFARIKYRGYAKWAAEGPGWAHDYARADVHLMLIMRDVTALRPFVREGKIFGGSILALDDPELFKYPVAYLSEPGGWFPNDKEARAMGDYLRKGGFVIFDDFREGGGWGADWSNLQQQMKRALPDEHWIQLTGTEPIFDSFFKIDLCTIQPPYAQNLQPMYFALYENNDPRKRIMAVANVNNDIGEFWEFSDEGFYAVPLSNEAYKLGVNYLIYALTH